MTKEMMNIKMMTLLINASETMDAIKEEDFLETVNVSRHNAGKRTTGKAARRKAEIKALQKKQHKLEVQTKKLQGKKNGTWGMYDYNVQSHQLNKLGREISFDNRANRCKQRTDEIFEGKQRTHINVNKVINMLTTEEEFADEYFYIQGVSELLDPMADYNMAEMFFNELERNDHTSDIIKIEEEIASLYAHLNSLKKEQRKWEEKCKHKDNMNELSKIGVIRHFIAK